MGLLILLLVGAAVGWLASVVTRIEDSRGILFYAGAGIGWFDITRLYVNTTACMFSDGTSMAAPHVSGVAGMAIQRYINNKGGYTKTANYQSIINAIYNGANTYSSLNSKVAGSRMLNANGTINQIDAIP